jgi:hypothetical protein
MVVVVVDARWWEEREGAVEWVCSGFDAVLIDYDGGLWGGL